MPVSDFLKEYMLKNGYTKADISRMSNIPYTTIDGLFKKGDENTKLSTLKKLAELIGCTIDDMAYNDGSEKSNTESPSVPLTPRDERKIAADLEKMLADLDSKNSMAAMGGTVEDDEDRELLKASLQATMRLAKKIAKEKYTPKKYRHEEE